MGTKIGLCSGGPYDKLRYELDESHLGFIIQNLPSQMIWVYNWQDDFRIQLPCRNAKGEFVDNIYDMFTWNVNNIEQYEIKDLPASISPHLIS